MRRALKEPWNFNKQVKKLTGMEQGRPGWLKSRL